MDVQQTSREAYARHDSLSLDDQILRTLKLHGPLTCEQIEERLGRSHQAVSGNLRHLKERGEVSVVPDQYGTTKSGRRAQLVTVGSGKRAHYCLEHQVDASPVNGVVRSHCGQCGRFLGYRWSK